VFIDRNTYNRQGWYHRCKDASLNDGITVLPFSYFHLNLGLHSGGDMLE